jgi:hypothetical protein
MEPRVEAEEPVSETPHTYEMTRVLREEPFQVNAEGTAWWIDKELTRYARQPLEGLPPLPDVTVLIAENLAGAADRIVLEDGKPVYHSSGLENVSSWLDALRIYRAYPQYHTT